MNDMKIKEFLVLAVARVFSWQGVEGVSAHLRPSFRFEDNGTDGMITVYLADDLKCSCIVSCDEIKDYPGDPMDLLWRLQRMVEGAMSHGEMVDNTPLNDVVSGLSKTDYD